MTRAPWGAAAMAAILITFPAALHAQLLSPGRLAEPHAELEGLRNCTTCHQLGKSGVAADRCLDCHEEIRSRVEEGRGYHGSLSDDCGSCHKDHLGEDFDLVRFDEGSFDHTEVGFPLELSHAPLDCRSCHKPGLIRDARVLIRKVDSSGAGDTFLGLPTECVGCHREASPHGSQFGERACAECHDAADWASPVRFDHRSTAFALTGRHADVRCVDCHGAGSSARYRPLGHGSCGDCHSDPHGGAMRASCASCHGTAGWHALRTGALESSFDHSTTSFALRGAHAVADCAACHRTGRAPVGELVRIAYRVGTAGHTYPLPIADSCSSCHVDRHATQGQEGRWVLCAECHVETDWSPSSVGLARHAESAFPLSGAHVTTPCVTCHQSPAHGHVRFQLALGVPACAECHTDDDPHDGQFEGRDCASCHGTDSYAIAGFDHATTRFPLDSAHEGATCAACHRVDTSGEAQTIRYRPLGTDCVDCHGGTA